MRKLDGEPPGGERGFKRHEEDNGGSHASCHVLQCSPSPTYKPYPGLSKGLQHRRIGHVGHQRPRRQVLYDGAHERERVWRRLGSQHGALGEQQLHAALVVSGGFVCCCTAVLPPL